VNAMGMLLWCVGWCVCLKTEPEIRLYYSFLLPGECRVPHIPKKVPKGRLKLP
jgi:hypothetical protein